MNGWRTAGVAVGVMIAMAGATRAQPSGETMRNFDLTFGTVTGGYSIQAYGTLDYDGSQVVGVGTDEYATFLSAYQNGVGFTDTFYDADMLTQFNSSGFDGYQYALLDDAGTSGVGIDTDSTGTITSAIRFSTVPGSEGTVSDLSSINEGASFAPEPGTWALMIAGVAMTGTALRRNYRIRLV